MESNLKKPKKGAGTRLRDFYNKNIRKQPMMITTPDEFKPINLIKKLKIKIKLRKLRKRSHEI